MRLGGHLSLTGPHLRTDFLNSWQASEEILVEPEAPFATQTIRHTHHVQLYSHPYDVKRLDDGYYCETPIQCR